MENLQNNYLFDLDGQYPENIRTCTRCNKTKLFFYFGEDKTVKSGRKSICKECISIYNREKKDRANELRRNISETKRIARNKKLSQWLRDNIEKSLYKQSKNRATSRGIEFNIELSDIIVPEYCPLLGIKLEMGTKDNYSTSPSLDRLDPTKGYIKGNVKVISSKANTMKSNATEQDLLLFCKNIPDYLNK